jgi:CRISPR-associated protein Csb2
VPSVARLHAALLSAAGFGGPRSVSTGADSLGVRAEDQAALGWLEENPPDSVTIPAVRVNIAYPVAYRDDGTIKRTRTSASIKKLAKSPGGGTAVAGRFAWIWADPPTAVRKSLEELCPDVPYLGTTESPARLEAVTGGDIEPTAEQRAGTASHDRRDHPARADVLGKTIVFAGRRPASPARDRCSCERPRTVRGPARTRPPVAQEPTRRYHANDERPGHPSPHPERPAHKA